MVSEFSMLPSLLFTMIFFVFFFPPAEFTPALSEGEAFNSACTVQPTASADWKFYCFIVVSEQLWYSCALALFPPENGSEEKYSKVVVAVDVLF